MVQLSARHADLLAYNSANSSEKRNKEVEILESRIRLVSTDAVPLLKDMKIIFGKEIYILDSKSDRVERNPTEVNTAKSISSVSNISTGSLSNEEGPLRFDFFSLSKVRGLDGSAKRHFHIFSNIDYFPCNPMTVQKALELRYRFKGPSEEESDNSYAIKEPVIIFTDAKDELSTAFLSVSYEKDNIVTGLGRFLGKWNSANENVLNQMSHRFNRFHSTCKASAVYNFLTATAPERRYIGSRPSEISMKFTWSTNVTPTSFLTSPSSTSSVIVRCSPGWKDPRVSLFEETCILEHLLCLAITLRDNTPMIWPRGDDKNETVIPRVKTLIEECSLTKQNPVGKRFFDFTEQLFDILRFCTTHETLVAGFKLVFNALRATKINTILHNDNKSTLARLIRDSLAHDLNLPRLENMTVLQMLLEIGVERFRRDMIHRFVDEKLVTNTEEFMLQYMENENSAEDNALKLLPLHMALVTVLELTRFLSMNDHGLSLLRKRVITEYTNMSLESSTSFIFETAVSFTDVNQVAFKQVKPSLWINETTYSSKSGTPPVARTVVHFTRDLNISYLEDIANTASMEIEETVDSQYICTLFTASYNSLKIFG